MEIHFFKREQLNIRQWDAFIRKSIQYRIYASSIWLDAFSPGWGALINKDYSAVMPLTIKKKYGISYLAQPRFTQQLGFYSGMPVTDAIKDEFIESARERFPFAEININEAPAQPSQQKKNYTLALDKNYALIRASYYKSLINNSLKPALKQQLTYCTEPNIHEAVNTYRQLYRGKMGLDNKCYSQLTQLAVQMFATGNCFTRQVNRNNELLAISLFFRDEQRIYNICSATTAAGRKANANPFLYDRLIQEFAASGLILDFEGSNIAGIEAFYKKFGATLEPYYFIKWNRLKWPYRVFKK
ncbi:hypothetical protein A8C56_05845 [Niabella ginsenosidivorans]|uniref:BioF2-like acetyltransferase domain-containing protein n=1 Tax=Niabella ginsenosidivorans TaxID=1176587 RepID=A0A1A9HZ81_9BACT|nr:hypothetical protein [Niabella ginsenosidivorans]ANH80573.1 hypothetical protein A8C56_05845 [Niabella ginsenosidivorans]